MEMTYGGALVMPSSYAMMDEEEMMYLEGGLAYSPVMRVKSGCAGYAIGLKLGGSYSKIDHYSLAAEIYTHALLYYRFGVFMQVAIQAGIASGIVLEMANSILDGINLQNGLDTRKIKGISYYEVYNLMYAIGPTKF